MSAEQDLCACGAVSTVGCTGVSNGRVYHEDYCDAHYRRPAPRPSVDLSALGARMDLLNSGKQVVFTKGTTIIDYWPASQKFVVRGTGYKGCGRDALINELEQA